MDTIQLLKQAQQLPPQERLFLVEQLLSSIEPDYTPTESHNIEKLWLKEAKKRLQSVLNGHRYTPTFDEVFSEK